MHEEEVEVNEDLVRRLLRAEVPDLADHQLHRVEAWGTDHVIFRLGTQLSVRLPKIGWAALQGEKERRWLPVLAPHLPVEVPVPVVVGEPADGYPYRWYMSPWIEGLTPKVAEALDLPALARELAGFVLALHQIDTTGGPRPRPGQRGGPLQGADDSTRQRAEELRGETDVDGLLAVWDAGLRAGDWERAPVWVHGDLSDGNLILRDGRLVGAIDWGGLLVGDPSVDLMVAWSLFDADSRAVYRQALGIVDEPLWLRGRAWAASAAINALPYYRNTNPDIVERSWRTVEAVLADLHGTGAHNDAS